MREKRVKEKGIITKKWIIEKFANEEEFRKGNCYERNEINHNCLVNEGINELWTLICSSSGTKYDHDNAYLIVGTGTAEASATDTESTFTNGVKKPMEENYPTYGTEQKATWRAVFGANDANQAWNEFGVLNGETGGKLLNRLVSSQGTKTLGQVWQLTFEISLS